MRFRLFGVDVEVQMFFWLTTTFFAYPDLMAGRYANVAVWIAVVFVSVLVHELGHALEVKRHRIEPEIALHGMGGTTSWQPIRLLSRGDHILISLAGPFAGFALGGMIYAFRHFAPHIVARMPELAQLAIGMLIYVNIYWGMVNLIPVLPFDGGHVLEHALGPKRGRLTAAISGVVGLGVAILAGLSGMIWMAMLFGMGAVQSYQRFNAEPAYRDTSPQPRFVPPGSEGVPAELAAMLLNRPQRARRRAALSGRSSIAETVLASTPLRLARRSSRWRSSAGRASSATIRAQQRRPSRPRRAWATSTRRWWDPCCKRRAISPARAACSRARTARATIARRSWAR